MSKSSIRFYNGLLLTCRRRAGVKNFSAGAIVEVGLENHLFPHTVPIKGRAQRQSVVQLDSGFGKGAEHIPRSTRSGYSQGAGRLSNQRDGLPGVVLRPDQWSVHMRLALFSVFPFRLFALRLQLGVRLSRPLPALRTEEFVYVKSLFPLKHVIDRPAQFVSEDR